MMATVVSLTFPLGRYHATEWGGGASTSEPEWPPSPWRFLRALLSVWHTRWPELPSAEVDALLRKLAIPDAYNTPAALPGSTRHYMPGLDHSSRESGATSLVVDAFLAVDPSDPLLIHWDVDLDAAERATLAKLLELMPYLGRSESVCVAELLPTACEVTELWWRRGVLGIENRPLLAPDGPPSRSDLEATTVATRKARLALPRGSCLITYGRTQIEPPRRIGIRTRPTPTLTNAIHLGLVAQVPVRAAELIVLTDAVHRTLAKAIGSTELDDAEKQMLLGTAGADAPKGRPHDHLHITPVGTAGGNSAWLRASTPIDSLILWSRRSIPDEAVEAITHRVRDFGPVKGLEGAMVPQQSLLLGTGGVEEIVPEFVAQSARWESLTPYLPVRHRKARDDYDDFLTKDLQQECRYRGLPEPTVERIDSSSYSGELVQFRRRRPDPRHRTEQARRASVLRLRFPEPLDVTELLGGPMHLGALSHFGFGLFGPTTPNDGA